MSDDRDMRWLYGAIGICGLLIGLMLGAVIDAGRDPKEHVSKPNQIEDLKLDVIRSIASYDALTEQIYQLEEDPKRNRESIDSLNVQRLALSTRIRRALRRIPEESWPEEADRFQP